MQLIGDTIFLRESKTVSLETTRIGNAAHRIRAKQGRNLHAPAASSDGGWARWRGWRQGRPCPGCGRRYNASQLWWWMGHGAFLHYAFIIFVSMFFWVKSCFVVALSHKNRSWNLIEKTWQSRQRYAGCSNNQRGLVCLFFILNYKFHHIVYLNTY